MLVRQNVGKRDQRFLMAHYMPWYMAKPYSQVWGWHWTMGHFNPDTLKAGRREAASQFTPLLGFYDSGDPDVLECHTLLMKYAGLDGVILDWYGPDDYFDYQGIHRNCLKLIPYLKKAGLRFAVCYEDQSVKQMRAGGRIAEGQDIAHGTRVLQWLEANWFGDPAYLRQENKPVLMVFGPQHFAEGDWSRLFQGLKTPPAFYTLHHRRGPAPRGAFDWPLPAADQGMKAVDAFYSRAGQAGEIIPVAFPRFQDIYKEAGVHDSYGQIPDEGGRTYESTLKKALDSRAAIMQVATWNDWGEGTIIEPSKEFGYRDLETTQRLRKSAMDPAFRYNSADLRLPLRLFEQRKNAAKGPKEKARLDTAASLLFQGQAANAGRLL